MNLAIWITLSRLGAIPILLYLLRITAAGEPTTSVRWVCVWIFIVAACTDWLDGYIARRFDQVTDLGKFLDPLVDKLLILVPLMAFTELRIVPAWTVAIAIALLIAPLAAPWTTIAIAVYGAAIALTLISGYIYIAPSR